MTEKNSNTSTNNMILTRTTDRELTPIEVFTWNNAKQIRITFVVILAVFVCAIFSAANARDVDLALVDKSLRSNTDITDVMRKMSDRELMQFIGLNANDYEQVLYYRNTTALAVDELLIVKTSSNDELDSVEEAVDARIDSQLKIYESYGPEQCAMLRNAVLTKKGNYYCYCVAEKANVYEEVLLDAIQ